MYFLRIIMDKERNEKVDQIMSEIPPMARYHWSSNENQHSEQIGSVELFNKAIILAAIEGKSNDIAAENIDENFLQQHSIYQELKVTKEEWLCWCQREALNKKITTIFQDKTTPVLKNGMSFSLEDPPEYIKHVS